MRVPICGLGMTVLLCATIAAAPSVCPARAQGQTTTPTQTTRPPGSNSPAGVDRDLNEPKDPFQAQNEARRMRSAATERQKKIIEDTTRLLQLATELKANVDKTTKDEMSLDVIRKADEIEKLAHDVKQRMKG
jgi:hypothetical protein